MFGSAALHLYTDCLGSPTNNNEPCFPAISSDSNECDINGIKLLHCKKEVS